MLVVDQYGSSFSIAGKHPRKEILEHLRSSHAQKMFIDVRAGDKLFEDHVGYIVGGLWLKLYTIQRISRREQSWSSSRGWSVHGSYHLT